MAEDPARRAEEIASLRLGLDLGMTLIDTAEMYADGRAEQLVAEAIGGQRDRVFLVSKVYPHNATRGRLVAACERSLARLKTDRLDLYLLHWRERTPLAETLEGFLALREAGKIRYFGVSNFDRADMEEWWDLPGGEACATNQVLYNLKRRGVEWDLLPWCRESGLPVMAYSPFDQGKLLKDRTVQAIAAAHAAAPASVALAWLLMQPGLFTIPKAGRPEHLRANRAALDLRLSDEDLAALNRAFPAPKRRRRLEMV